MADKKKKILGGVGAIAALIVAYFGYQYVMYVNTDNAAIDAHTVMLAPKVSGYVVQVNAEEGQQVKKDDVLVQLDERDYLNTVNQVHGELTSAEAMKKDAEKNYARISSLYKNGAVSQQQYDTSFAAFTGSKAKYDALSASLAQAQLNLENTKIKAPMDGYVAKKSVEKGQLASPGVPLIGFVGSQERWVTANFKETELAHIKKGAKSEIEVDALPGRKYEGEVESISSATGSTFTLLPPDNATGNFTKVVQRVPVKIKILNLNEKDLEDLRAGLSVFVKVRKN